MTPTTTPRLGLTVDALNETQIGVQKANWDRVDYAQGFARAPVGSTDKYDGQLSVDPNTGIAVETVGSTVQDILYPYLYGAYSTSGNPPNATYVVWGWDLNDAGPFQGVNGFSDLAPPPNANGWKVPYKGLYRIISTAQWAGNVTGIRSLSVALSGGSTARWDINENPVSTWQVNNQQKILVILQKGNIVNPAVWQNTGGNLAVTLHVMIELVRIVQ